jgi:hypothetical protein
MRWCKSVKSDEPYLRQNFIPALYAEPSALLYLSDDNTFPFPIRAALATQVFISISVCSNVKNIVFRHQVSTSKTLEPTLPSMLYRPHLFLLLLALAAFRFAFLCALRRPRCGTQSSFGGLMGLWYTPLLVMNFAVFDGMFFSAFQMSLSITFLLSPSVF